MGGYIVLARSPRLQQLLRPEAVRALIDGLGPWGPAALVGAMAATIVFSPVPSAPIALAAGAFYGHTWGTIYAVLGAEIGALVAFGIAPSLGRPFVTRMLPNHVFGDGDPNGRPEWLVGLLDAGVGTLADDLVLGLERARASSDVPETP